MAVLHGILSVRLQDYVGIQASHRVYFNVNDTDLLSVVVEAVGEYCTFLAPCTDAIGTRVRLELEMPTTGLNTSVTYNTPIEAGGLFTFNQANINRADSIVIPAFANAQISNGKIILGGTSPAQNWIGEITATDDTFEYESAVQNPLPTFLSCKLNTRKYRKSETRMTSET